MSNASKAFQITGLVSHLARHATAAVTRTTVSRVGAFVRIGRSARAFSGKARGIGRLTRLGGTTRGAFARGHKFFGNQYTRVSTHAMGMSRGASRNLFGVLRGRKGMVRMYGKNWGANLTHGLKQNAFAPRVRRGLFK